MRAYSLWIFLFMMCPFGLASEPVISVADLKADFEALYRGLQEAHVDLYANMNKAAMDREFKTRLAGIDQPMSIDDARVYFQRFVALGKIAHGAIDLPVQSFRDYLGANGVMFPLDLKGTDSEFFITANDSGIASIQAGDKLIAINGLPMAAMSKRLSAYVSADTDTMLHGLFELQFPFLMWLELGGVQSFEIGIEKTDRQRHTVTVPARTIAFMQEQQQKRRGRLALDGARSYRVEANGVGYLRPGPFFNLEGSDTWDAEPFQRFVDEAFEHMLDQSVHALIIDLRDNPGGTNTFSDYLLAWFATEPFRFSSRFDVKVSQQTIASNAARLKPGDTESISARYARAFTKHKLGETFTFPIENTPPRQGKRFDKPVFVLINRHSYSNAVFVAAIVQDYGFGTVIGEETNDLATTYGAMEHFSLPKTGITVGYPKARIVRPNGDDTIRGVVPDIAINIPLIEAADDPVLKQALRLASKKKKPTPSQ